MKTISHEYIRGLVDGEGCFTFFTVPEWKKTENGELVRLKRPVFTIQMNERDEKLLESVNYTLELSGRVYWQEAWRGDGVNRGPKVSIIVRNVLELRNKIIPIFYGKLHGHKGKQFIKWLEKMGEDDKTRESRYLHMIYKKGFFEEWHKEFLSEKDKNVSVVSAETGKT
ncbi:MAG: LAGLIDADG family homing endonuclease [bacterium]|nr:LAGLIDADG family homing endonuclease [bacterium]